MRQVSLGLYAVIIACFFLPWFQVGCGVLQVEVTGFQLAKAQYEGNPTSVEDFRAFEQVAEALSGENKKAQWWLFGILFASAAGIISQLIGPLPGIHFLASLICMSVPLGEYVYLRNQIPPEVTVFVRMQSLAPFWILVAVSLLNLGIASIQSGLYGSIRHRRRERRKFDFDPVLPPPPRLLGLV